MMPSCFPKAAKSSRVASRFSNVKKRPCKALHAPSRSPVVTVKIWLDGESAYETGKYKYEYAEKGKPTTEEGRYVTIWKRQDDSSWKLSMDMAVPEN
jgi:ketosteroid isomerase-like protein